ncbi:MAG: hypothetical protein LBP21_00855 [Synergistaceae bacterium]|jgi:hypothetical protein|nr:hypothetical protein [Synergistaceae bacterium]
MKKFLTSIFAAAIFFQVQAAWGNEYLYLQSQMKVTSREGIGPETLEIITDASTPSTSPKQATYAYIFHIVWENRPSVAELGLATGFFLPIAKGKRPPVIHNVYFHVDGDKIPRATLGGSGPARTELRDNGVFIYVNLGTEEALTRRIAESKKTTVTFGDISYSWFNAGKDVIVGEIAVTPQEKEAMKRVIRFYELLKED